jgi:hypothetical protein
MMTRSMFGINERFIRVERPIAIEPTTTYCEPMVTWAVPKQPDNMGSVLAGTSSIRPQSVGTKPVLASDLIDRSSSFLRVAQSDGSGTAYRTKQADGCPPSSPRGLFP